MTDDNMYRWPDYYDWTSEGLDGDIGYYTDLSLSSKGPVLELGCGTGRCSLAIARHGVDVVGVDREAAMLEQARRKSEDMGLAERCDWVLADMAKLELNRTFPLVIIPYRSFLHLLTVREQIAALAAVRKHLEDDGLFAFNIFVPHIAQLYEEEEKYLYRGTFPVPGSGETVEVYDFTRFDHYAQQARVTRYYERFDGRGRSLERLRTFFCIRYIFPTELYHLLRLTGFEIVNRFGNFDREPFSETSTELIIEARKAKPDRSREEKSG